LTFQTKDASIEESRKQIEARKNERLRAELMATLNTKALEAADRLGWLANRSPDKRIAAHPTVATAMKLLDFLESRDYLCADADALSAHLRQHLNSVFTLCRWLDANGYIFSRRESQAFKGGRMIYGYCPPTSISFLAATKKIF
jgi:hypothetical protein